MQENVLLCQSERNLSMILSEYLENQGYHVTCCDNPADATTQLAGGQHDILIIDLDQDNKNTFLLLRQARQINEMIPIFVLNEHSDRDTILQTYKLGADDVIRKPFSMDILIAKIRVWRRRDWIKTEQEPKVFTLGSLHFDSQKQLLGSRHLSGKENELLLLLCRHEGEVVDRHDIMRRIWRQDDFFVSRSLSVFINHLRSYLKDTGYDIIPLHRKGYKLLRDA